MTGERLSEPRHVYVVVKARNTEHAEAVAMELAAQGLRVACLDMPAGVDMCSRCGPMLQAQKRAFTRGVLTAAITAKDRGKQTAKTRAEPCS